MLINIEELKSCLLFLSPYIIVSGKYLINKSNKSFKVFSNFFEIISRWVGTSWRWGFWFWLTLSLTSDSTSGSVRSASTYENRKWCSHFRSTSCFKTRLTTGGSIIFTVKFLIQSHHKTTSIIFVTIWTHCKKMKLKKLPQSKRTCKENDFINNKTEREKKTKQVCCTKD